MFGSIISAYPMSLSEVFARSSYCTHMFAIPLRRYRQVFTSTKRNTGSACPCSCNRTSRNISTTATSTHSAPHRRSAHNTCSNHPVYRSCSSSSNVFKPVSSSPLQSSHPYSSFSCARTLSSYGSIHCANPLFRLVESSRDTRQVSSIRSFASIQPENVVYSGPSSPSPKRVTLNVLRKKYKNGEPITVVTAYDYPSAVHVDQAQLDVLLVGDSVAMVVHGHDTTLPVTLDDMLLHCRAVARGAKRAFLVGDLPFGSYETSTRDAVKSAVRMLKEGGMDAVKLEGGSPARVEAARAIVETGVAVMGHVGLTPQSISAIGGFRPQAQAAEDAHRVLNQALALQAAGCFALVLECVPAPIAACITKALSIPTIGIGAGPHCSGQVLVYHDLLGMLSHPHHAKVTPKFCKQYAQVGTIIQGALQEYKDDVTTGRFPGSKFSPYKIAPAELTMLAQELRNAGMDEAAGALEANKEGER